MSLEVTEPVPKDRPGNQAATRQLDNSILIPLADPLDELAQHVGTEEWKKILNAAETPTRRPTPVGHEFTPQAELTDDEYRSLFPPTP